jgi:hypothetical protein
MSINIYRGDASPKRQILRVGPPAADQFDSRFVFTTNGKSLAFDGWDAGTIAAGWEASTLPEFAEVAATVGDDGVVTLTGPADGTPFEVSVGATATVTIATVATGEAARTEVQRVTLPPATGGTFTLSYDAFTSAAIAYNADAATIEAAISPISTAYPGVTVTVTGSVGGPFDLHFNGGGPGSVLIVLNASSLTGATSIAVATTTAGVTGVDEVQQLQLYAGGTHTEFRIKYPGFSAFATVYVGDATNGTSTAAEVETALEGLFTAIGWSTAFIVSVASPSSGVYTVTLKGSSSGSGTPWQLLTISSTVADPDGATSRITTGVDGRNEVQTVSLSGASGGTFTLTYSGQTTAGIAWNATPAAVKAALEALSNITTVFVSGTPGSSYVVTFVDPGEQDVAQMTASGASLTAGGSVVVATTFSAGVSASQTVTLPGTVTSGTFVLSFLGDRSTAIDFDASAADVDTALEAIEAIGAGGVSVTKLSTRVWQVTWTDKAAHPSLSADASGLTVGSSSLVEVDQNPGGPTHWNDPGNWTQDRPPETGDIVWLDQPSLSLLHSLRQRTGFSLNDSDTDTLLADGAMHFAEGQKITLRTTNTLPGGLSAGNYYVVDPDRANRTFKLSATRGGSVVDLASGAGTGTHLAVVELDELHPTARFSGRLGLPRRNALGYWEYRPQYLAIGFRAAGAKVLKVGEGDGPGSGRLKVDCGADEVEMKIIQTAGSVESGVPACLILGENAATDFVQLAGDTGLAFFPSEIASIRSLDVRGGSVTGGEGLTITADVTAIVGSVRGVYIDASGNEHRWE